MLWSPKVVDHVGYMCLQGPELAWPQLRRCKCMWVCEWLYVRIIGRWWDMVSRYFTWYIIVRMRARVSKTRLTIWWYETVMFRNINFVWRIQDENQIIWLLYIINKYSNWTNTYLNRLIECSFAQRFRYRLRVCMLFLCVDISVANSHTPKISHEISNYEGGLVQHQDWRSVTKDHPSTREPYPTWHGPT